jgi:prolipoprotein diacylglyceryltransferase
MEFAFNLGPFPLSPYGILITIGVIATLVIAAIEANKKSALKEADSSVFSYDF